MYSQDLIDAVLKHADIVQVISAYIPVIKKGRSFVAVCPFHDDTNPSMNISQEKQIFKCFVCGTGGNAITFVEKYEKIRFEEAVRKVADLTGFHDERLKKEAFQEKKDPALIPLTACIDDLQKYYVYSLEVPESEKARAYLKKRNIPAEQIAKHGIGYAPLDGKNTIKFLQAKGHSLKSIEGIGIGLVRSEGMSDHNAGRVIFPLHDPNGQVVGFSARRLEKDGTSKYINSPDGPLFHKGKILYNYHNVKISARKDGYCYLVEGFMDVMALERAGLPNAVAIMGTSLTSDQLSLLRRLNCEIRFCLDGDAPGQSAMMKNLAQFQKAAIPFRIVSNPGDLRDPDEILQEDGPERLKEMMGNLVDAYDFQINYYTNTKKLETAEDKRKVMLYFLPFLRSVPAGIDRDDYIVKLSKATGYEVDTIYRGISKLEPGELTEEETILQERKIYDQLENRRQERELTKLRRAERAVLHYMLNNIGAIDYFETEIENFYDSVHEEIANYIIDYAKSHDDEVDVSGLVSQIAATGADDSEELQSSITTIALDNWWPPYNLHEMEVCREAINEGKSAAFAKSMIERSMEGKSDEEKARLIKDYARRKREDQKNRKKRIGGNTND
ncbi:MAG: DNA primase [Bacilli bacterium]|nr:DNA primase [Bacilli bacterium]